MAVKLPSKKQKPACPHCLAPVPIEARIDGGYIVIKHGRRTDIFELVWEQRHADSRRRLVLKRCPEVPRQFEREVYQGEEASHEP